MAETLQEIAEIGRKYMSTFQILNVSAWSQRIRAFLPSCKSFHVHAEDIQGRVLVPGTYCTFMVAFHPTSIHGNLDALFISSEMDSFELPVAGSNPLPTVFVPPVIDVGYCLKNHAAATSFPIASLEAASKFQVAAASSEPSSNYFQSLYSCENILHLPPFLAYPKSFSLCVNESTDVITMFRPVCSGHFSQTITISSEYGHKWNVLLEGQGIDIDVQLDMIDGRQFRPNEIESGLWFGNAAVATQNTKRELIVRNRNPIPLRFYWKLEPVGEDCLGRTQSFSAHPCFGTLQPDSEASFTFTFCPSEIKVCKQRAVLYLDTRQSFVLSAEHWEQFRSNLQDADRIAGEFGLHNVPSLQTYAAFANAATSFCDQVFATTGADNCGSLIRGLEVDLVGSGNPFEVELLPPLLAFSDMLAQGRTYTREVEIKNNTYADVGFSWQVPDIPWAIEKDLNTITVLPVMGKIKALGSTVVNVTLRTTKTGAVHETLICLLDDPVNVQLSLLVEACVQGPRVSFFEPMLDFGLVELGSTVALHLTLINKSVVDAPFKLLAVCEGEQRSQDGQQSNTCEALQELFFCPDCGVVPQRDAVNVMVDFVAKSRGQKTYAVLCQVANGTSPTQYSLVRAYVESPRGYFTPCKFDLGTTFMHRRLVKTATLHNLTGLTIYYRWPICDADEFGDNSSMKVDVTPREGELAPHSSQDFCFRMTPLEAGEKEFITVCDIMGAETPIGVLFRTFISDFRCSYHVLRAADVVKADLGMKKGSLAGETVELNMEPYFAIRERSMKLIDATSLEPLDFGRCQLGCVHWLRLVMQNHTDISSKIHVALKRYGSSYPPPLSKEDYVVLSALTGRPLTLPSTDTLSVLKTKRKKPPLIDLPDEVHHKYWSRSGHFMVSRRLELEMHNILISSGEGISLLLYPDCEGSIESWGQWWCDIFCFSCLPGSYVDVLTCSVGGLPPAEIPVSIVITGSPLYARPQHIEPRGYQHPKSNDSLVLKWPPVSIGHLPRTKKFWVANVSPYPLELRWEVHIPAEDSSGQLYGISLLTEDDIYVHVRMLGDPDRGPVQVHFEVEDKTKAQFRVRENFLRVQNNYPFRLTPLKQVVPMQGNVCFEVVFYANNAAQYTFVLLGRTRIPDAQDEPELFRRPSRRVTFHEATEIVATTGNLGRRSSVVTFSDGRKSPDTSSELIKITTAVGKLNEPLRANLRKPSMLSVRTAQGLLLSTRPERKSSLKRTSIQVAGQPLLRDGPEKRSSLKRSSVLSTDGNKIEEVDQGKQDEMIVYDGQEGPVMALRLCFEALVFEPRLKPCGDDIVDFFCDGIAPLTDKAYTKVLVLMNEYPHSLNFKATVNAPFYLARVESGLTCDSIQNDSLRALSSKFTLPSGWSLHLTINFRPDEETVSKHEDIAYNDDLVITFFDQYIQRIPVQAQLIFPAVRVLSEDIWFGTVVINAIQTLPFSVLNASYFDTQWQLVKEELVEESPSEDPGSTEEPSQEAEAIIRDPFHVDVEGSLLPGRGTRETAKQTVTVTFKPPEPKTYRQVFRIEAVDGRGCTVVMEGQGILETPPESEDVDPKAKGKK